MLRPCVVAAALGWAAGGSAALDLVTSPAPASKDRPPRAAAAGPADAAGATARAGDAGAEQIRLLEQQVQVVLTEARRQQALLGQLRQDLATAQSANAWLPWLVLGLVAAGVLAAWLALRVRRLQRELARHAWASAADARQASRGGAEGSGLAAPISPDQPLLSPRQSAAPSGLVTAPDMTIAQPRIATPAPAAAPAPALGGAELSLGTGVPPRPVSVEELLDLDQQVDFFLVLGQVQAAIDLLLGHVRSTGGTYALPYFKLLEIYRQQGDEEAYERTRERFNQRFNAFAPEMSADLARGRSLEDYGDVLERLQRAWPQPLRAVAELESLLLRRADLEPFDLPAYREVLMLHALVRDLPAGALQAATTTVPKALLAAQGGFPAAAPAAPPAEAPAESGVDLLLPLADSADESTVPHSLVTERAAAQAMLAEWVFTRATQPRAAQASDTAALPRVSGELLDLPMDLDLDLTEPATPPREFTHGPAFGEIEPRRDSRPSDFGAFDGAGRPPAGSAR